MSMFPHILQASMKKPLSTVLLAALLASGTQAATADDPHQWLEDVLGDKSLAWVKAQNAKSEGELQKRPEYAPLHQRFLSLFNNKDRIPYVSRQGSQLYNLWQDERNPRGIWRRTTLESYRTAQPAWETVLDVDALGKQEGKSWVFAGANCLAPSYTRCLISLSPGGGDSTVVREFDTVKKAFIDGGFQIPEAKQEVVWQDENTLIVGSDFGPGSLTDSGYPRVLKRWKRGTPLASAETVFEGEKTDVAASAGVDRKTGRVFFSRALDFYRTAMWMEQGGQRTKIDKPEDAGLSTWRDGQGREWALLTLKSDQKWGKARHVSGSLLAIPFADYLAGKREFTVLFKPTASRTLADYSFTRSRIVLNLLNNVVSEVETVTPPAKGGAWAKAIVKVPGKGTAHVSGLHDDEIKDDPLAEAVVMNYSDFLTPDSLMFASELGGKWETLKSRPALFNADGAKVEQRWARSKDGTRVPYFLVLPKGVKFDSNTPTLLYGYGGFEVSLQAQYYASWGAGWLERGGAMVIANIRGGGEFGPKWHESAILKNKQKSYDDFIAVAEQLIKDKLTSPRHLGIMGGSNGGLLVGATMVQRPDLFNAVVCQVPLLDMKRFHLLLAGASWMAEYGNPDKAEDWASLSKISPYHNVFKDKRYPRAFFLTSTRDDRVHPGHARKMAARMEEQGHPLLYWENTEGGHGGAADNGQRAVMNALEFTYLWMQLGR